jgi:hypothetical protein
MNGKLLGLAGCWAAYGGALSAVAKVLSRRVFLDLHTHELQGTAFTAFCLATANFLNATNRCAASTALSVSVIGLST